VPVVSPKTGCFCFTIHPWESNIQEFVATAELEWTDYEMPLATADF